MMISQLCYLVLFMLALPVFSFKASIKLPKFSLSRSPSPRYRDSTVTVGSNSHDDNNRLQLGALSEISTALIAMGDYAAEIEKGVGEEIYLPIFRSGLLLFGSGIASAIVAVAIISKAGTWDALMKEFDAGLEAEITRDPQNGGGSQRSDEPPAAVIGGKGDEQAPNQQTLSTSAVVDDLDI